ncbi:MAG: NfeD family protein [Verrucomicrobiota bacterium]
MLPEPCILWFIVGLVLILAEFFVPGIILIFIGMGAWVTSLTSWLGLTTTLASQTAVFALSSIVLLVGLRRFFKDWFMGRSQTGTANEVDEEFIGKEARVVSAISPQVTGKVEFKGAQWNARSTSVLGRGDMVLITARDGLMLIVTAL